MMVQIEQKYKRELRDAIESHQQQLDKAQATINKLEKERKILNEKVEISAKSLLTEQGGLEKKVDKLTEEKERLTAELEAAKAERDKKVDALRTQFDREKELLKQKAQEAQQKSKAIEARQTELIMSHETNRAKWDQEKSYVLQAKEDAVAEMKTLQRKYENLVKENERIKEQSKRNNPWRYQKQQQVGNVATNNAMLYNVGKDVLGRLNLGGAGPGLNRQAEGGSGAGGNPLMQSTNNLNVGAKEGGLGTFRSNLGGVDKSMDNLKLGFQQKFGGGLGTLSTGTSKLGAHSAVSQRQEPATGGAVGAVAPGGLSGRENLNTSMRNSNIMNTPSSKGGFDEGDSQDPQN